MLKVCLAVLVALIWLAAPAVSPAHAQANFDRPGADYAHQPLQSGDPADCALACEHDRHCRAWSFNYPNEKSETAVCWLKNAVPPRMENLCCVSGVRGAGVIEQRTGPMENSTDRAGGDYRGFEIKTNEKPDQDEACRQACEADNKCRAWTYARPRYAGKEARCFLKKDIKPPRRKPGFTSGVVR
jgi:PAN domain